MFKIKHIPVGLLMGVVAIFLWSSMAALLSTAGQRLGVWQFLACATAIGSLLQFFLHAHFQKNLSSCIILGPQIWFLLILFLVDIIFFTWSLTSVEESLQICNVNLIHYSWPSLSVIFAVILIPDNKFTWPLIFSLVLSIFGLIIAHGKALINEDSISIADLNFKTIFPYLLATIGAMSWATYSALINRWKCIMKNKTPVPMGLFLSCLVSAIICTVRGEWIAMSWLEIVIIIISGIGPLGLSYTLWESGLYRYSAVSLGMVAAGLPILSTLILCLVCQYFPNIELIIGAFLISFAIIITVFFSKVDRTINQPVG